MCGLCNVAHRRARRRGGEVASATRIDRSAGLMESGTRAHWVVVSVCFQKLKKHSLSHERAFTSSLSQKMATNVVTETARATFGGGWYVLPLEMPTENSLAVSTKNPVIRVLSAHAASLTHVFVFLMTLMYYAVAFGAWRYA